MKPLTPFERWVGSMLLTQQAALLAVLSMTGVKDDPELWGMFKEAAQGSLEIWETISGEADEHDVDGVAAFHGLMGAMQGKKPS